MLPDNHFFFFDFTLDHTKITPAFAPATDEYDKSVVLDTTNLCPYKIPTIDEILKLVNQASHRVNPNKFLSDTFECGAIAVSNQFDFPKAEQREERSKQIMRTYEPKERELMAEAFAKIYALLTSVVYDDGTFNDWLGELFMQTDMGNKHNGQFFTPYHISSFPFRQLSQWDRHRSLRELIIRIGRLVTRISVARGLYLGAKKVKDFSSFSNFMNIILI